MSESKHWWNQIFKENRFWSLFQSGELSDVTLIVGEKRERIESHKVILAAASPIFKKYFTEDKTKGELIISTVESDVFRSFLKFIYTGKVSIDYKNVIALMNAAKYYQVEDLEIECKIFREHALTTEQNALVMYQQAIQYGEKDLEEEVKKTVCRYAHRIIETDEFLEVSEDCLLKLLREDDLTVKSEVQVFDALIRWAKAECQRQRVVTTSESCRFYLKKLIPLVRFPQMDEGDFALKVAHGQIKILSQEELLSVYFYPKIPTDRRSEVPSSGLFNCKPRRYIGNINFKIHVLIHDDDMQSVTLDMTPLDTILNVKERIQPDNAWIRPEWQRLIFRGDVLEDKQTLLECNISEYSSLQCFIEDDFDSD